MAFIHWEPFQTLNSLRQQVDHLFEELRQSYSEFTSSIHNLVSSWQPAIEIQETPAEIVLKVEMPDINARDLDVRVSQNAVSIRGEHRRDALADKHGSFQSEFRYGQFQRHIPLPKLVRKDQVQHRFKDGLLILMLPKVEKSHSQVVRVNLAGTKTALDSDTNKPVEQAMSERIQQVHLSCENNTGPAEEHSATGRLIEAMQTVAHQQVSPRTSLDQYCDEYPDAAACRIYDV